MDRNHIISSFPVPTFNDDHIELVELNNDLTARLKRARLRIAGQSEAIEDLSAELQTAHTRERMLQRQIRWLFEALEGHEPTTSAFLTSLRKQLQAEPAPTPVQWHSRDEKTRRIYEFIIEHKTRTGGQSPSIRDIRDNCGLKTTSTVAYHFEKLEKLGLLHRKGERFETRRIQLTGEVYIPPTTSQVYR